MMKNTHLIIFILFIVFLGFSANIVINKASKSTSVLPKVIRKVPRFNLLSNYGTNFTEDSLKNKITVLDFIFTSCPGPCPIMSGNMRELYKQYSLYPDLQFISISVDPDFDTKQVLIDYANLNEVTDKRWKFLRGEMNKIKRLSTDGFMFMSDNLPAGHSVKFVLIDYNGNIRQYYDGTDKASISILRNHINIFLQELNS